MFGRVLAFKMSTCQKESVLDMDEVSVSWRKKTVVGSWPSLRKEIYLNIKWIVLALNAWLRYWLSHRPKNSGPQSVVGGILARVANSSFRRQSFSFSNCQLRFLDWAPCSSATGCEPGPRAPWSVWRGWEEQEGRHNLLPPKPTGWRPVASSCRRWGGSRRRGRATARPAGSWRWSTRSGRPPGSALCKRRCPVTWRSGSARSFLCWCSHRGRHRGQVKERRDWLAIGGEGGKVKEDLTPCWWVKRDPWLWVVWLQLSKASMTESVYAPRFSTTARDRRSRVREEQTSWNTQSHTFSWNVEQHYCDGNGGAW